MPVHKYFKNALLAGAMLLLGASVVAPGPPIDQAASQNLNDDDISTVISATEKADQEHFYLEEVLGAKALAEVKT